MSILKLKIKIFICICLEVKIVILELKFALLSATRPAWAGFKTAEEGRANTPFRVGEPCGPRG
jgi:hypothetical protein